MRSLLGRCAQHVVNLNACSAVSLWTGYSLTFRFDPTLFLDIDIEFADVLRGDCLTFLSYILDIPTSINDLNLTLVRGEGLPCDVIDAALHVFE